MDPEARPKSRLTEELESLRRQIAELQKLVIEPALGENIALAAPKSPARTLETTTATIQSRLGFLPPFLLPGLQPPPLLETLSQQMLAAYLENSLPDIVKEKLFARLSRRCPVLYATVSHSCILRHLGMTAQQIALWLQEPIPQTEPEVSECLDQLASVAQPLVEWPESGSELEQSILVCAMAVFLPIDSAVRCRDRLRDVLGPLNYARLITLLGYIRTHHLWLEAYPELPYESDGYIRQHLSSLMSEAPELSHIWRQTETVEVQFTAASHPHPRLPEYLGSSPQGAVLLDSSLHPLDANKAFLDMLGCAENELDSISRGVFRARGQETCTAAVHALLAGDGAGSRFETVIGRKDGTLFWASVSASIVMTDDGNRAAVLLLVSDFSDRKAAVESLRDEQQFSQHLLRSSVEGVFAFNREGILTRWNPGMERIFGVTEAEATGKPALDFVPVLREPGDDQLFSQVLLGETVVTHDRTYRIPETGKQGYFEARYVPLTNHEGEVVGGLGLVRETTEQKKVQESHKASEERYRDLFENAHDMIYAHDLNGIITSVNNAAEQITGYSRTEFLKVRLTDLVAPDYLELAHRMLDGHMSGETPATYELEIIARDGHRVALEINSRPIFQGGKVVSVQGIARDVTERKKAEEALQQANRKLEAWVTELQQRTREMTLLNEMGDMLRACMTTEEAYAVIVRIAQQIFPVQVGALYVISPSRNLVDAVAAWGDASAIEQVFAPDECWALRRGRVHSVEDTRVGLLCKHLHYPVPKGYMCVPMMAQSQALGVLHLTEPDDTRENEARQRLAVAMAEHIAMALSNLKLHETLRSQSIRDPVTSLFNRHFMEESLELELRRAARNQRPLGLIMLELDNFKSFVDSFGREGAETAVRETAGLLQTLVRREDVACRLGGEKFVIILPQGGPDVSRQRAEGIRELIKRLDLKYRNQPLGRVTASIGVAVFPDNGRTVEALLRATEGALHRARSEGGDRVEVAC